MTKRFFSFIFLLMTLTTQNSCTLFQEKLFFPSSEEYNFKFRSWSTKDNSDILILAIHGYNDYSFSFDKPARLFSKFNIETISFDLRGFGQNSDHGEWFPLSVHVKDTNKIIKTIKKKNPNKRIFLLGESMGAAILVSLVNQNKNLPIEGVIFVAPAFWNASESNPIKSFLFKSFSFVFPNIPLRGNSIVKVRPTDNLEMLKIHSEDPFVVHAPKSRSVAGLVKLMDIAYEESKIYLSAPHYKTLIVLPLIDEIVPRKPIIKLLKKKQVARNFNKKLFLFAYEKNFHMILRDLDGDRISREIKEWILDNNSTIDFHTSRNVIQKLENTIFFHKLD